jgi:hypothetical protein
MLKRRLGRTDFEASVIGFGCGPYVRPTREEGVKALRRAIQLGVNLIDTARSYGDSEAIIAEALKDVGHKVFVATKSRLGTGEEVARSIEESLRQLQVSKLDLIQMHGVDREEDLTARLAPGGDLEAMKRARESGKVDFIGISGHRPEVLAKAIKTGEFDVVTTPYNLLNCGADYSLFPLAEELDIGILAIKPLDARSLAVPREMIEFELNGRATSVAEAALRFALANRRITSVVVGMTNVAEVEANVPLGYEVQSLSPEQQARLKEQARMAAHTSCDGCARCAEICPYSIDIVRVFKQQVLARHYGMKEYARAAYKEVSRPQVQMCTSCQLCIENCPSQLDIPALLRKADIFLS